MRMFKLVAIATLGLTAGLSAGAAQATTYVPADNNPASIICVSAAMDNRLGFHLTVKDIGWRKAMIANKVSCNGTNIARFALQAGNEANYKVLAKYRRGHVDISDIHETTAAASPLQPAQMITVRGR